MINGEIFLIPVWVIVLLTAANVIYRLYVVVTIPFAVLTRLENALYVIALMNVGWFYSGIWVHLWTGNQAIALSRFVWAWLLFVSLYISNRMAKRNGN